MWFITFLCLIFVYPAISSAGEVPYSAIVLGLAGNVTVIHEGKRRALELGYLLYPGDRVEIAEDGSLTIHYPESGQEEQWPGGLRFSVGKTTSEPIHSRVKIINKKIVVPTKEPSRTGGGFIMRDAGPPKEMDNLKEIDVK